jgi:hypothetical protein
MTALLEFYYRESVSDMTESEIGKRFAKLVYVLEWQSEQAHG